MIFFWQESLVCSFAKFRHNSYWLVPLYAISHKKIMGNVFKHEYSLPSSVFAYSASHLNSDEFTNYCNACWLLINNTEYHQLRARRALFQIKDVLLRTRRALLLYTFFFFTAIAPFWFSTEHLWSVITLFWLSTDDIQICML